MLEERPKFKEARMLKAEILIFKKQFNEALTILQSLEKENPRDDRVLYFQGLCQIGLKNNDLAKAAVARAVELNPGYFQARLLAFYGEEPLSSEERQ